jgi:hypothetical protein
VAPQRPQAVHPPYVDAQGVLGEFHFGHGTDLLSDRAKDAAHIPAAMMTSLYVRRIVSEGLIHRSA